MSDVSRPKADSQATNGISKSTAAPIGVKNADFELQVRETSDIKRTDFRMATLIFPFH